ncbi:hypothetical protein AMTRI_Chr02g217880 [Amborella trichopoda]
MILPNVCLICKSAEETIDHLFVQCPFAASMWDWLRLISSWITPCLEGIYELLQQFWTLPFSSLGNSLWRIAVAASL